MKTYGFFDKLHQTEEATKEVTTWLESLGYEVVNVEYNLFWQKADVDILVFVPREDGRKTMYMVEIKIDFIMKFGNFFFETKSCVEKNTPGCFMYTMSNYIFYYFYPDRQLYKIPTQSTRNWFIKNQDKFRTRQTSSPKPDGTVYHTEGKLVPIKQAMKETNIELFDLSEENF